VFPGRIDDLARAVLYVLALDEAGYADDGLLCALDDGSYLTSTSGGAERMDARGASGRTARPARAPARPTSELGAILVAGPRARDLLQGLTDEPIEPATLSYPGHREIVVAGIPCRAIRNGFVGELAFELHHPRSRGPELWDALLRAGEAFDVSAFGLDALEVLRLEKGHVYLGQDTLPDDTPDKLGLGWAVEMTKPWFVGKPSLERLARLPRTRRLAGLDFDHAPADAAELRGVPLTVGDSIVGRVTSSASSRVLDRAIGPRVDPERRRGVPDRAPSRFDRRTRRADTVLRSRGGARPWLSSGPHRPP
jgi:sarcosine oxidase subunit alpha